jgi:hypothetical protein
MNASSDADASAREAARLRELFKDVELPEIVGIDFSKMNHADIAALLPPFGGKHPTKAILIDRKTGKAYGIASGWEAQTLTHNGMPFRAGVISPEIAAQIGRPWTSLGNHAEPAAAAFMRRRAITDAVVYVNARNPCWGTARDPGCYYRMPTFLAEGSRMSVYNKDGSNFVDSWPDRKFHFTGLPD